MHYSVTLRCVLYEPCEPCVERSCDPCAHGSKHVLSLRKNRNLGHDLALAGY